MLCDIMPWSGSGSRTVRFAEGKSMATVPTVRFVRFRFCSFLSCHPAKCACCVHKSCLWQADMRLLMKDESCVWQSYAILGARSYGQTFDANVDCCVRGFHFLMLPMCREGGWEWTVLDEAFQLGYLTLEPNPRNPNPSIQTMESKPRSPNPRIQT